MIRNRLNELMKIKKVRVKDLNEQLGISRATLVKIRENTATQMRYDTINKLCKYLNVTLNDFFEYTPMDISICSSTPPYEVEKIEEANKKPNDFTTLEFIDSQLTISVNSTQYHYCVDDCQYMPDTLFLISFISFYDLTHEAGFADLEEAYPNALPTAELIKDWKSLPDGFKTMLEKRLYDNVRQSYKLSKTCKLIISIDFLEDLEDEE